jgi:hypothetical protein
LSLRNRRGEYAWKPTRIDRLRVITDRKDYVPKDTISANVSFSIVGGLREAFHPDVWTTSWEDFDKILRLSLRVYLGVPRGPMLRTLAGNGKEVRKASFYWSRDPDLPYRIWAMVVPEDGGPPIIPHSVEDAKSKMLDCDKTLKMAASALGPGRHRLVAGAEAKWPRKSFIEKGSVSAKSAPVVVDVE